MARGDPSPFDRLPVTDTGQLVEIFDVVWRRACRGGGSGRCPASFALPVADLIAPALHEEVASLFAPRWHDWDRHTCPDS